MKIIPSILTNDFIELNDLISKAETAVDRVQIDVLDDQFANNITIDRTVLKNISTFLNLDFHLMVKNPVDWINHCLSGKKNRIIGQIEEMKSQVEFVEEVISLDSTPGLGLDLDTPVSK